VAYRVSLRLAVAALVLLNLGAAVPYGISDLHAGTNPNTAEWVLSGLFGLAALVCLTGLFRPHAIVAEAGFVSGGLWFISDAYIALDSQIDGKARAGLGLMFAGIALGCFALWQRLRAATE